MSITHEYVAQELYKDRIGKLDSEAEAARLVSQVRRRPRSRRVSTPWWNRLRRTGLRRPRPA
jgi:hypothetical protein